MEKKKKQGHRFNVKNRLLALYLSIGIMGIGMLAFSAWTPVAVSAEADAGQEALHASESFSTQDDMLSSNQTPGNNDADETILPNGNEANSSDPQPTATGTPTPLPPTPTSTPSPTPSPSPTPTPNPLMRNAFPEINTLVKAYYNAKLSGEEASFAELVSDPAAIDIDYLNMQYGLVTEFKNFTVYTKNGIDDIAYIVYVSYDSKIVTINTPVPSLDRLTLVYADDGSGALRINNASTLSDAVEAYCEELFAEPDVKTMYEEETKRFEEAIASDSDLQQLYQRLEPEGAE